MAVFTSGGATNTSPVIYTQTGNINLSANTIAEYTGPGVIIGYLSIDVPGGPWYFTIPTGYDVGGGVTTSGIDGTALVTTTTQLIYQSNPTPVIRVVATNYGSGGEVFSRDIALNITYVNVQGPSPTIDLDLINQVYTGATLANLGLVTGDLSVDGYHAPGTISEYIAPNSMSPGGTGWGGSGSIVATLPTTPDGFTPVQVSVGTGALWGVTCTRNGVVGELYTVRVRLKGLIAYQPYTYYVTFEGASGYLQNVSNGAMYSAGWVPPGASSQSGNFVSGAFLADGSWDLVYQVVCTTASPLQVLFGPGNNPAQFIIYGVQVHVGLNVDSWLATGNTATTINYKAIGLGGPMNTLMTGSAWTLAVETHSISSAFPSTVLSDGSSNQILQITGFTSYAVGRSGTSVANKVGMGGTLGINRMVIAGDGTNTKISINNGIVATSSTPLTFSGTLALLTSCQAILRRVSLWNSKLTDAQLQQASSFANAPVLYPGTAMVPYYPTEHFFDDFTSNTIKTRPGNGLTYTDPGTSSGLVALYAGSAGNWIPHTFYGPAAVGNPGGSPAIAVMVDPQYCSNGLTGGYLGPYDFNTPSCLAITIDLITNLPSTMQSAIAAVSTLSGCSYVAGTLMGPGTTYAGVNSFWSSRIKVPSSQVAWPAWWGLVDWVTGYYPGYEYDSSAELDILEIFGPQPRTPTSTIHANSYGFNEQGTTFGYAPKFVYNLYNDFHTYEAIWTPGNVTFGLSGMVMSSVNTAGTNFDTHPQFPLLDIYAQSGQSAYNGTLPSTMLVDHVRTMTTVAVPATLGTLTLSALTGSAASYSATVQGTTAGSTLSLVYGASNQFILNGTTIYANPATYAQITTVTAITVAILETLPSAIGNPKLNYITVTLNPATTPSVPTGLRVTTTLAGAIGINYTAGTTNDPAKSFVINYRVTGATPWITYNPVGGAPLYAVISNLAPSTTYDLRVAGINLAGTGPFTSVITGATVANGFYKDTFTPESPNIIITAHTPEIGGSYSRSPDFTGGSVDAELSAAGFVFDPTADYKNRSYTNSVTPTSANYSVSGVLTRNATSSNIVVYIQAYMSSTVANSNYGILWNDYDGLWHQYNLGVQSSVPFAVGDSHILTINVAISGSVATLTAYLDGVSFGSGALVPAALAAGFTGFNINGGGSTSSAVQIDYMEAR